MAPRTTARRRSLALIAGAVLLTALNLRTAVASVPPLLDDLRAVVPLSGVAAGALTTLPVVCMAAGSPLAPVVARRFGFEAALAAMALAMAAGMLVRLVPGPAALFAGTTIAGLGIAIGNVLVPAVIKRDFPGHVGAMTGAYTMAVTASGALGAALTVPAEDALGEGPRAALAVWAVPAVVAAVVWLPWLARGAAAAREARALGRPSPTLWRSRLAWQVTAFMGLQSLMFYSVLSWLPTLLRSEGIDRDSAGALLSVMLLAGVPTCLLAPLAAARARDQRPAVVVTLAAYAAGLTGLLLAPDSVPVVWSVLLGFAQGALLALAFLFFGLRSPDQEHAAELSAMAQSVGYLLAAAGPLLVGVLHEATGGWSAPLIFLLAVLAALLAAGLAAGRDRQVQATAPDVTRMVER